MHHDQVYIYLQNTMFNIQKSINIFSRIKEIPHAISVDTAKKCDKILHLFMIKSTQQRKETNFLN